MRSNFDNPTIHSQAPDRSRAAVHEVLVPTVAGGFCIPWDSRQFFLDGAGTLRGDRDEGGREAVAALLRPLVLAKPEAVTGLVRS